MSQSTKYFVVGDVHGTGHELEKLILPFVNTHQIVLLGDLFDRGLDGVKVWELIGKYNLQCCTGNHERKFLNYLQCRRDWLPLHYYYFLNSFTEKYDLKDLVDFLFLLPLIIKIDDNTLVTHGGICLDDPWREDVSANIYGRPEGVDKKADWSDLYTDERGPTVLFGHKVYKIAPKITYNRFGQIMSIGLDQGACNGGYLTGVEVHGNEYSFHQVKSKDYYSQIKQIDIKPNEKVLEFRKHANL